MRRGYARPRYLDALGERVERVITVMMAELTASISSRCLAGPEFRARTPDYSTLVAGPRKPCMIRYRRVEATP